MTRRRVAILFAAAVLIGIVIVARGYWNATRDPVVRTATVVVPEWPASAPPMRVLLLGDTHVAGPDMPPARLRRIVAALNRLNPDLTLIAGDMISEKTLSNQLYTAREAVAPLTGLRARFGVFAVLGNHDHWYDANAFGHELARGGVRLLDNSAVVAGPVVIGGIDDAHTLHDNVPGTLAAIADVGGGRPAIVLSHSPDIVPDLSRRVAVVVAGHTHCGQIALPWIGPVVVPSRYGRRFACGDMVDNGQRVIVTAGIGTSIVPLRLNAPGDVWLITLRPR